MAAGEIERVISGFSGAPASLLPECPEYSTISGNIEMANGRGCLDRPRFMGWPFTVSRACPLPATFQDRGRIPLVGRIRPAIFGSWAGLEKTRLRSSAI